MKVHAFSTSYQGPTQRAVVRVPGRAAWCAQPHGLRPSVQQVTHDVRLVTCERCLRLIAKRAAR